MREFSLTVFAILGIMRLFFRISDRFAQHVFRAALMEEL
jgi:hypothetical protein